MRVRSGLAVCGVIATLAVTGCGSSGSGTAAPSWAKTLGSGVTIDAPASVSPGQDSPGAVATGLIDAISAGSTAKECPYLQPSEAKDCRSAPKTVPASQRSTVKNFKLGYVAIHGSQALVGTQGTFCSPDSKPKCFTNSDPAAIFSGGKSFSAQWKAANNTEGNVYSLLPCVKSGGKWYAYSD